MSFEIAIEGDSATVAIIFPYPSISGVAHKLNSAQYDDNGPGIVDAATTAAVKRALTGIEIELRAEVASTELSVDQLLSITPGDVIQMNGSVQSGVTLYADKTPIHRSRPGRLGGRRAVQILERLDIGQ